MFPKQDFHVEFTRYCFRDVLVVNCPGLKDKIAEASQGGTDQQQQEEGGETARDQIASPRVGDPENPVEVTLQDVQCEDVRELMKCIYPKHKPVTGRRNYGKSRIYTIKFSWVIA